MQVVRLRRRGLRLRPAECDPPERGELRARVEDSHNPKHAPRRVAILFRMEGADPREMPLLVPLFDPRLIRLDQDLLELFDYVEPPEVYEFEWGGLIEDEHPFATFDYAAV